MDLVRMRKHHTTTVIVQVDDRNTSLIINGHIRIIQMLAKLVRKTRRKFGHPS